MYKHLKFLLIKKRNIFLFIISLTLALIGMAIVLYEPQLLGKIIDQLPLGNGGKIQNFIYLYIACSIIGNISVNICKYLISRINSYIIVDLRDMFFSKLVSAKISNIELLSKGDLISKFETDISIIANFLTGNAVDFFINIFSIFIIAVYIFNINFTLSLILLIFIPVEIIIIKWLGKISKKNTELFRKLNSKYLSFFEVSIIGLKDIKSFNREQQVKNRMKTELNNLFYLANKTAYIDIFINVVNKIFLLTINVLIMVFFVQNIIDGNLTVGLFIAFFNYSSKFYSSIFGLTGIYTKWQTTSVSLNRVVDLFNIPQEEISRFLPTTVSDIIEFKKVDFSYDNENIIFSNLNVLFKEKTVNLIIGNSGIGKTTLCELLLKFYEPKRGNIIYGSCTYSQLDHHFVRERISYISQSPVFFDDSIVNNIFVNATEKNISDLSALLKEFNLLYLLDNLYKKFNFNSLSVGQKQRLNIIRGILKNATIYIFDEPTSSIDNFNKLIILNTIDQLSKNKTVIIITHDKDVINFFKKSNIVAL
ncbi:ABC transporter transmembrane domain-containing protein [Thomasclavelia sp.]